MAWNRKDNGFSLGYFTVVIHTHTHIFVCVSVCLCVCVLSHFSCIWLWDPGKNTGVGCHALLQEIFPTQGLNPHPLRLLHCRQILLPLSYQESLCVCVWVCVRVCVCVCVCIAHKQTLDFSWKYCINFGSYVVTYAPHQCKLLIIEETKGWEGRDMGILWIFHSILL